MRRLKVWHWILIIVIILGAGTGGFFYFRSPSANAATPKTTVQQVTVAYGNMTNMVSASGSLAFPNQKNLTFGNAGTVGEISVKEGESVKSGQTLAKLTLASLTSLQTAVAHTHNTISYGWILLHVFI